MKLGGEACVSVFDIVFNASFFIIYMYNGTAEAMQPLVSTFAGENSEADCREVLTLAKRWGICIGGVAACLIFVFPEGITAMFGLSGEVVPMGVRALRIYCVGFAFAGLNILHENYYLAKEDGKTAFVIASVKEFLVLIPCTFLFASMGTRYVWFLFPVSEFVSALVFQIYLRLRPDKQAVFDQKRILRRNITKEQQDISLLLSECEEFCEQWNGNPKQTYFVTLIIEEICMSIIRNALEKVEDGRIRVTLLALENGDFMLHILDNAVEFNPFLLKAKKIDKDKEFDIDGVSMTLIKEKAKEFMHRECQGFNSLVVRI